MLPKLKAQDPAMDMLQTTWAQQIDPVLRQPILQGNLLKNVALASGANVVNHKLGRKLQGWFITRLRASATVYDTQDSNNTPALTLALQSSAAVVADIYVF